PVAGRRHAPRAPRVAEHALLQARELGEVLVDESVARPTEAREPIFDIGGVAGLRHLAVANKIDARRHLLFHHLGYRLTHTCGERSAIYWHASFLGMHRTNQIVWSGQTTGMGGQEALSAEPHWTLLGDSHG